MNHLRYLWNYFQSERSYYSRSIDLPNRPFVFSIETTSYCNLRCVMCPYKDMTRPHEMIEVDLFEKIVDEVADYNGIIWLHNLGEPLAHPKFDDLIRYVKRAGLKCGISTNATLLNEARIRRVLSSGLDKIILCMDGITKETYEKMREGANFEQVTANIERFLQRKREAKHRTPEAIVQLIYMRATELQVPEFRRRWGGLADKLHIKRFSTWAEQVDGIAELSDPEHRYEPEHSLTTRRHPCAYLWRNVVVTANGDVIPCCVDYDGRMVMGNMRESTLEEIWHGDAFRKVRQDHVDGRFLDTCATCREWVGGPANPTYPLGRPVLEKVMRLRNRI